MVALGRCWLIPSMADGYPLGAIETFQSQFGNRHVACNGKPVDGRTTTLSTYGFQFTAGSAGNTGVLASVCPIHQARVITREGEADTTELGQLLSKG